MARHRLLALLAFVCVSATSAWAAEPGQSFPQFSGPYIGGLVGYGRQKVSIDNLTLGTSFRDQEGGVAAGGYAGYNWQFCGPYLLGIEGNLGYLNASPAGLELDPGPTGLVETTTLESKIDWFGTLLARAGYVIDNDVLIYATGGFAFGRVNHTLHVDCLACGSTPRNLGTFEQSNKNTRTGWAAGGGGEYMFAPNWVLRGQALYVDLGSDSQRYTVRATAPGVILTATSIAKWDDQFWLLLAGLSYQFNAP